MSFLQRQFKEVFIKQVLGDKSFKIYIYRENKLFCVILMAEMMLQFILFKYLYPFPDFFADSYSYINAASLGLKVNVQPIGYSIFLQLFHLLTTSGTALVFFQYFTYCLSSLYFYLTITYFYPTGILTQTILRLFLFFNPIYLYLANYVTGDMLYVSMNMIWLTQLIWLLRRPKFYQAFLPAGLILLMFTFRYTALIYPVITAIVVYLSNQKFWIKSSGVILPLLLLCCFITWTETKVKQITASEQFPPILGGWERASKALYMRPFIREDSTAFPTLATAELDGIARKFIQDYHPQNVLDSYVGNFFIRQPEAPLKQYLAKHFTARSFSESVAAWGKAAVVFDQYGKLLIRRHPLAFLRYYLLLNTKNYFVPPLEELEEYNIGRDVIQPPGQLWFHYQSPKIWCISKELQGSILLIFPVLFTILNLYYIIVIFMFLRRGRFKQSSAPVRYTVVFITSFLILNAISSVFSDIIVIRHQIFPLLVILTFAMVLTDNFFFLSNTSAQNINMPDRQTIDPKHFIPAIGR